MAALSFSSLSSHHKPAMEKKEQTRFHLKPGETIRFGFEDHSPLVKAEQRAFKKFQRGVYHYANGAIVTMWRFPDGTMEISVK